ncbi:MAG: hypothetical protein FWE35_00210 [Streptosporangiales bacterium]|nr:hypothetical protein [Streptosporangiales bacterium]
MATGTSRDLALQLSRAERLLSGRVAAILAREECTVEEWRVLKLLSDGRGHFLPEVADFAMLSVGALTDLVNRMVSEGLLYRRETSRDSDRDREPLAYLSLQGRDRYEGAAELISAAEAELSEAIGDQGELAGWLDRLCGVLSVPAQARRPGRDSAVSPSPNA